MRLYNTLSHALEVFAPLTPGPDPADPLAGSTVRIYSCGPTVYDYAHIGNFRSFLFADVLRRYLEFRGATVRHIMNMTDVGHMVDDSHADARGQDKMALAQQRMRESKKSGQALVENPDDPYQVAQFFVDRFLEDARALQLAVVLQRDSLPADQQETLMPRPTRFIEPFIRMIQMLLDTNHAYIGADGVVYFSVASFREYGRLSGNTVEELAHGAGGRTAQNAAKRHPADFFLWKPDPSHIMRWPSPWGEGYPGWHIECSAMATTLLGPTIDIHTGGEDNIFPHHECEIAQAQAATGQPFSRFWLHARHLMVDGAKMSKSKGNFFNIRDLAARGFDPLAIRYALIATRYRESMNFSVRGLHEAASAVGSLRDLAEKLIAQSGSNPPGSAAPAAMDHPPAEESDRRLLADFAAAMNDDLNIAGALGTLFSWAATLNKHKKVPSQQAASALAALRKVDHVLAVIFTPLRTLDPATSSAVTDLLARRAQARAARDFAASDALRNELTALGIEIKDTPAGATWRPRLAPPV